MNRAIQLLKITFGLLVLTSILIIGLLIYNSIIPETTIYTQIAYLGIALGLLVILIYGLFIYVLLIFLYNTSIGKKLIKQLKLDKESSSKDIILYGSLVIIIFCVDLFIFRLV